MTLAQADVPAGLRMHSAEQVSRELSGAVGARAWDRDPRDQRVLDGLARAQGKILDSEAEHPLGLPRQTMTRRAFAESEWNLADMSPKAGWGSMLLR